MENETSMTRSSSRDTATTPIAPGIAYMKSVFANLYFVDNDADDSWALVDAGLAISAGRIRAVAERRYGRGARPTAIVLTHGHFDHAGSALALAEAWDVPIYAHRLELPYLTGKSDYPPQDPTVRGALAQMSRLFPHSRYDFGSRVHALPTDGSVPGLKGWRAVHTPGHTAGHIVYFRERDRVLLAGDALATENQDTVVGMLTHRQVFRRPPAPFTTDWQSAHQSIKLMADLQPAIVGAGHGIPMTGANVASELRRFADNFEPPRQGRYIVQPARADENGVVELPPPVPDSLPKIAAGIGVAAVAGAVVIALLRRGRKS